MSARLADRNIATFRYQFPYMQAGEGRPDPPPVLHATVLAAVQTAAEMLPSIPLLAGGKSLGGRMTSQLAARESLPGVQGLVFLGFPLHAPKQPSIARGEHLDQVALPMFFLQGTRDTLADLGLIKSVCERLGDKARLHVVEGADHSFKVLKRSGRTETEVLDELADTIPHWADALPRPPRR
jgi:predicted alpha/beta-hydrolase family hydrolase